MKNKLNASEALFGFCGWLTTQEDETKMSSSNECADIAQKIKLFIDTNHLPEVRKHWDKNLKHPLT